MSRAGCSLLFLSCDARADIWRPSLDYFARLWPDCPFPKYFVGETVGPGREGWRESLQGKRAWSDILAAALAEIDDPFVLVTLDDFFLTSPVNTARVLDVFGEMMARGGHCVRLRSWPGWEDHEGELLECSEPVPRVALQVAIWRKSTLQSLLVPGEDPWQFEINGSERSKETIPSGLFVVRASAVRYLDAVAAGKWKARGKSLARQAGYPVDLRPAA